MIDFTTYTPPGVYIEEDSASTVSVVGVAPTVVALVGPAVGYRTYTETLALTATDALALSHMGVDDASVVVSSPTGTVYVENTDYTVATSGGADSDLATLADNVTTVARIDGGGITDGALVYVSYHYTDGNYYNPLATQDFDDVKDAFGPPIDLDTGDIISPLSFAAQVAISNGARHLICVPTQSSATSVTRTQLSDALKKLETIDVDVVVPLPVGISGTQGSPGDVYNVGSDLKAHVETMEGEGLFRIGVVGMDGDASVDPAVAVDSYRSRRIVSVWPNRMLFYHGYKNLTLEVAGYYLAAAVAGRISTLGASTPLTKKEIVGFSGIPSSVLSSMTVNARNAWSAAGVAVVEKTRAGNTVVRHGVTTDKSSTQRRELSLVRARDNLVDILQRTMDSSDFVGGFIDENTPSAILGVVTGVLESAKSNDLIVGYKDLKIRQTPGDPSVMEVRFAYQPAYPLNYIVFFFSIDTTVGTTDFTADTTSLDATA